MWSKRGSIDYTLSKRATLSALFKGSTHASDACDADPYLLRAAKFHGEPSGRKCPICRSKELMEIRYTFGDQLGQYS